MIKLPNDYMDYVRVRPPMSLISTGEPLALLLLLSFKNRSGQHFRYYQSFKDRRELPKALESLRNIDTSREMPYVINKDLTEEKVKALDQRWKPAPEMLPGTIPLRQYDAQYA